MGMYLSTGKAHIRRQVDCWMTFEEYDALTRNLAQKYPHLHAASDGNAFWPGQLLDKLRLNMPGSGAKSKSTVFNAVKPEKNLAKDNAKGWTLNDHGFIQRGDVDPYYRQKVF